MSTWYGGMITPSTCTSYRRLGNTRACFGNTRTVLQAITAKPFFILKARDPLRVVEHVIESEPFQAGRQGSEPWGTWQHRSPLEQGGGVRSYVTHGSIGALLSWEAGSGAMGHMAAPEPASIGRQGPESCDMWQHWSPPEQRGRVQRRGARGSAGAHLGREAGSKATGHMAVHRCMPFSLSWIEACMRGYPPQERL
jgi:hypothetical protein